MRTMKSNEALTAAWVPSCTAMFQGSPPAGGLHTKTLRQVGNLKKQECKWSHIGEVISNFPSVGICVRMRDFSFIFKAHS